MKILIAGDWHSNIHEHAVADAFSHLGHECVAFPWFHHFGFESKAKNFVKKIQNRLITGPLIKKINHEFVSVACSTEPDVIFIYRGTHITYDALNFLKKRFPKSVIVGYNNDDPFSQAQRSLLWRHFVNCIPLYDLVLAYRHHNMDEYFQAGAKRVELLRSWFIPELNYPCQLSPREFDLYGSELAFAGHYEPDGRDRIIERLVKEGFNLKLYGPEWTTVVARSQILKKLAPVVPVRGEEYNKALCGAKIALCFLSKLNRDTYTRRCFEIPASGTFMLSEYSDDISRMFREGLEVEFFRSEDELVTKATRYLNDDAARLAIAEAGLRRVNADGHDIVSRMKLVTGWIKEIRKC